MFVLDTNVLVRFAVNDDAQQVSQARRAIGAQPMWISAIVLLDAEWVLRSRYGYQPTDIHTFLTHQSRGVMLTFDASFCKPAQKAGAKIKVLWTAVK